jgi:hypothetical protein
MRELTVKGLQPGWKVLMLARGQQNPYDAIVLCERDPPQLGECNFVTWRANLELGGCSHGNYHVLYRDADLDFMKRKQVLR